MNNPTNSSVPIDDFDKNLIHEAINALKEIKSGEEKLISWDLVKKWMG